MIKIYNEETMKDEYDKYNLSELSEMVGWIDFDVEHQTWDVRQLDGCTFSCSSQETAQIMANTEEIKALLLRKNG